MDIQKWGGAMDCIDVVQNRDKWRDLVNGVMKLGVLQNAEKFLTS
jgi:hypothetical protein